MPQSVFPEENSIRQDNNNYFTDLILEHNHEFAHLVYFALAPNFVFIAEKWNCYSLSSCISQGTLIILVWFILKLELYG